MKCKLFTITLIIGLFGGLYLFAEDEDQDKENNNEPKQQENQNNNDQKEPEKQPEANKEELEKKANELIGQFRKNVSKAKTDQEVAELIKTLAQMKHPLILKELIKYLSRRGDIVREASAEQIANYTDNKEAAKAIFDHIAMQKSVDLKIKFFIFLGRTKYRPATKWLIRYFDDPDTQIAQYALEAAGKLRSKDVIEPMLTILKRYEGVDNPLIDQPRRTRQGWEYMGPEVRGKIADRRYVLLSAALSALNEITGEQFNSLDEWEKWWKKNKDTFQERPFDEEKSE